MASGGPGFLHFIALFDDVHGRRLRSAERNRSAVDTMLWIAFGIVIVYGVNKIAVTVVFSALVLTGGNHTYFQPLDKNGVKVSDAYEVGPLRTPTYDAIASELRSLIPAMYSHETNADRRAHDAAYVKHFLTPPVLAYLMSRKTLPLDMQIDVVVHHTQQLRANTYEVSWTARQRTAGRPVEAECVVDVTVVHLQGPPATDLDEHGFYTRNALGIGVAHLGTPLGMIAPPPCYEPQGAQ